ncbi:MAG: hypothetical protein DI573_10675 [Microbacterium sp.]|nr:MAG: hypothetical protein DI573_10675 [Microbacterium sp.]
MVIRAAVRRLWNRLQRFPAEASPVQTQAESDIAAGLRLWIHWRSHHRRATSLPGLQRYVGT